MNYSLYNQKILSQVLLILVLCFITIGLFYGNKEFEYIGNELIKNGDFQHDLVGWNKPEYNNNIFLSKNQNVRMGDFDKKTTVYIRQFIKGFKNYQFLKFSGSVKTEGVIQGEKRWEKAHIVVVGVDQSGHKLYENSHLLVSLTGSQEWHQYDKIIEINKDAKNIVISAQMTNTKGILRVQDFSLRPVKEKDIYNIFWVLVVASWLSLLSWVAYSYLKDCNLVQERKRILFFTGLLGICVLIPQQLSTSIKNTLLSIFSQVNAEDLYIWPINYGAIDKVEHIGIFVILSLVVLWKKDSKIELFKATTLLMLIAFVSEVIQLLTNDRNIDVYDFVADITGIFSVLIFILFLLWLKNGRKILMY